ncbi:MAG: helix-hairpin-helix domain-containing protein [Saprospiraceae bacterium]
MDNNTIAKKIDLLAKIMELYDENPFKIRSYSQAYSVLRKVEKPFSTMDRNELEEIPGVGKTIAEKIEEVIQSGSMLTLEQYLAKTPPGIIDMLNIRGFGPKKVKQIWQTLEIESIGELLYACNENRIASLKGFGMKTQQDLIKTLEYAVESKGKYLFSKAEKAAELLLEKLQVNYPEEQFMIGGEIYRQLPIVKGIELYSVMPLDEINFETLSISHSDNILEFEGINLEIIITSKEQIVFDVFERSCSPEFFKELNIKRRTWNSEEAIFEQVGKTYVPAPRRDNLFFLQSDDVFPLLTRNDCVGTFHHHTTYSDGIHTLEEMYQKATLLGYEYMVITDHSQSAFYANGLKMDQVIQQWREIDQINDRKKGTFLIKGIESDILSGGELDYSADELASFQCIIASIHSNLKMDEEKGTKRLIKAIENPFTKILGHPTSRLLLSRPGYPVKMNYIIDACAANGVAIELNANPQRLDVDYTHLDYIAQKEVLLSVNPDAHSADAIEHVNYGISVVQKANINPNLVLNTWSLKNILEWLETK